MTQQRARSANFGPTWPEVAGFGAGPNKQFLAVLPKAKLVKTCNCGHSCPACRLAHRSICANFPLYASGRLALFNVCYKCGNDSICKGGSCINDNKKFGSRIKIARQELGITIEKAAELCAVSESIWRQYEKGSRFPILNRFIEICIAMKQRPEYFFADELQALYENTNELTSTISCLPENDIEILLAAARKMKEQYHYKVRETE